MLDPIIAKNPVVIADQNPNIFVDDVSQCWQQFQGRPGVFVYEVQLDVRRHSWQFSMVKASPLTRQVHPDHIGAQ